MKDFQTLTSITEEFGYLKTHLERRGKILRQLEELGIFSWLDDAQKNNSEADYKIDAESRRLWYSNLILGIKDEIDKYMEEERSYYV